MPRETDALSQKGGRNQSQAGQKKRGRAGALAAAVSLLRLSVGRCPWLRCRFRWLLESPSPLVLYASFEQPGVPGVLVTQARPAPGFPLKVHAAYEYLLPPR